MPRDGQRLDPLRRRAARLLGPRSGPLPGPRAQGRARAPTRRCASWSARSGLRNDIPSITEGVDIGPEPTPFQQAQQLAADGLGGAADLVPDQRRLAGQPRDLPGARARRRAGRRAAQRPLLGDRRARPQRDAAELRRARARPRARHRPLPDAGLAGRGARRDPGRGRRRWSSRRPTSAPAPTSPGWPRSPTSRGVPLVVDEAWGAHLRFHPDLPPDALSCGADLVVSSTHKIVGSLTQAAMLHLGEGELVDEAIVDRCVSLVETTSPSALLSGSLDAARRLACGPRRGAARRDPGRDRRHPRGDRGDPRPRGARRQHGRPGRDRRLGPAAARRSTCAAPGSTGYRLAKRAFELDDADRPRAGRREPRRRDLRPRRARRARRRAAGRRAARRGRAPRRGRGGAAAGAAGAAAALGRAGDDPARGLPRPAGGRPLRRRPPAGSRPSRWPPIRPASPTSSRASG